MVRHLVLAILVVTFWAAPALAADLSNPFYHFHLTVPAGWKEVDSSQVASERNVPWKFVGGAQKEGDRGVYCVAQAIVSPAGNPADYTGKLTETLEKAGGQVGKVSYDPDRKVLTAEVFGLGPSGNVASVVYCFCGMENVILLHCYAPVSQVRGVRPAFDEVAATFSFDQGYAYSPFSLRTPGSAGVVGGLVVGTIAWLRRIMRAV